MTEPVPVREAALVLNGLDEPGMSALAQRIARVLHAPLNLYFQGNLGAGKTTFIRALIQSLGHVGAVKSPTYGLMEHYALPGISLVHLDLYRIGDPGELEFLGLADWLGPETVLLVEWPEQGAGALPAADLVVSLRSDREQGLYARQIAFYPQSDSGIKLCQNIDTTL